MNVKTYQKTRRFAGLLLGSALLGSGLRPVEAFVGFEFVDHGPILVHERAGVARLTVARSGVLGDTTSVGLQTMDDTAVAGRDYVATRRTLVFGPEDRTLNVDVTLLENPQGQQQTVFHVLLERLPTGGYFSGPHERWVTIQDDTGPATAWVEFASLPGVTSGREGQASIATTVVRSGPTGARLVLHYGTEDQSARAGEDYVAQVGLLIFEPGEVLKAIEVPLLNDAASEGDETLLLNLHPPVEGGGLGAWRTVLMRVQDDDAPAVLEATFRPDRGLDDRVRCALVQPDGRLLVAGDFNFADGLRRDEVARFHPDGSLDLSFDPGPTLRGRLGLGGLALALQADGKVLVGGDFNDTNEVRLPVLVRLGANGAPDPTFAPDASSSFRVRAIAVQPDGKVLIGGSLDSAEWQPINLMRLHADGSRDLTFEVSDGTPMASTPAGRQINGEVLALALQGDGKILLAGNFVSVGTVARFHVARLDSDGILDPTFDPGRGADEDIGAILVQPDGRILVAGEFTSFGGQLRGRIARLEADGSVDPSFAPAPGANREIHAIALQPDGQIVIGGEFTEVDHIPRGHLARLGADGALDLGFNPGAGADDEVRTLAITSDAVYAGGDFTLFHGVELNRIARLRTTEARTDSVSLMLGAYAIREDSGPARLTVRRLGPGAAPMTVDYTTLSGTAGTNEFTPQSGTISFGALETEKTILIPLRDDPIVEDAKTLTVQLGNPTGAVLGTHAAATVSLVDDEAPAVLDPSFGPPQMVPQVQALALQPDGALLLGGQFGVANPGSDLSFRGLARLHPDGSLDTNFAPTLPGVPVRSIALLPAGDMLVGGRLGPNGLVRLGADGAADPSFIAPTFNDEVRVVLRSAEGQFLVGGDFTEIGGVGRRRIARLDDHGALDPSFDAGSGANDQVLALLEQPDRRVLVGGRFTRIDGIRRTYLARLLPDGRLDPGFNAVLNDRVRSLALLAGGRVLVGGRFTEIGGASRLYLARLEPDGSLDATFAPAAIDEEVRSVAVLPDGRVVIAGEFTTVGGYSRRRVARLNPDGSLDALFQPGTGADWTVWVALAMADGRIVIGGEFWSVNGQGGPALARLNAEQPPGLEVLPPAADGSFGLRLHGVPPNTYEIEASADLMDWTGVATRELTTPSSEWVDSGATGLPKRFYRAWRVPSP